jgi:thioredoxin-like negative regulator of GroEL
LPVARQGKGENAIAAARAFAMANPGTEADLLLADTLFALKRIEEADAVLDKSFSAKPDVRVVMHSSLFAMSSGNFKKAGAVLSSWIAKNPNDFLTRREYAGLPMGSGSEDCTPIPRNRRQSRLDEISAPG